jgi:hypothetical protein
VSDYPGYPPNSNHIKAAVHERLHAKDSTGHGSTGPCHSYSLDQVVWETLALLGEWELIQLEDLG